MGAVYLITCARTEKVYVGSTVYVSKRERDHFRLLRSGRHHAVHLQRAFAKHGESEFVFGVVEIVEDDNFLLAREQFWMWRYEGKLYNSAPKAHSQLGIKRSQEVRERVSQVMMGNTLRLGSTLSAEARRKIGDANILAVAEGRKRAWGGMVKPMHGEKNPFAKLTVEDVLVIRASDLPKRQLAEQFNVSRANISLIINRKAWATVGDSI